jgi:EAL domain-containing protein (putative c-di-GMP-specific phosphodiesterase class I)
MKNKKLKKYKVWIFILFISLGILVGGAVTLLVYALIGHKLTDVLLILFFADLVVSILVSSILTHLFSARDKALVEQASTNEYFLNDQFVYNETLFKNTLSKLRKKNKDLNGIVACLGVKDLNSDILSLYGSERVKEVNETIFNVIHNHFNDHKHYLYAFNVLDDFLIYSDQSNPEVFYTELGTLSKEISAALSKNGDLPYLTILIGAYPFSPNDEINQIVERASYAEKYNSSTRLSNDVVVFSKDMVKENVDRDLSYELTKALDEGQFDIYYQPKFDLKANKFYGAEALIRWNHPLRGLLPPSLFIPFCEQSGKIMDLDRYVFRHVCQDIANWEKDKKRLLRISVNLSRRSVYDPSILDFFAKTMAEYKVNPLLIDIELTESVASKNVVFTASVIKKIKAMGMTTSIDDFGVGYSSFSALKKIPFDTLKIDKTFVDDIEIDKKARDLVECVIRIGHSLDMIVIAEGVQSEKQVEILRKLGLNAIQGFYYSPALGNYDFHKFLDKNAYEKGRSDKQ